MGSNHNQNITFLVLIQKENLVLKKLINRTPPKLGKEKTLQEGFPPVTLQI